MKENDIGRHIVDTAIQIHRNLGPGLLEIVYEKILSHELSQRGLHIERQVPVAIRYGDICFDEGFRADLVVESRVIVELKSIVALNMVHRKQLLTYLRLTDMKLGYLLNFGEALMTTGIIRVVNQLTETGE